MSSEDYEEVRLHRENMAEEIARAFHESYERLAPNHGYKTREASAVPWADVPPANKALMMAVAMDLVDKQVIAPYSALNRETLRIIEIKRTWGKLNDLMGA